MNNEFPTVRILVDNEAAEGLKAEHGLSMLIECQRKKIEAEKNCDPQLFCSPSTSLLKDKT